MKWKKDMEDAPGWLTQHHSVPFSLPHTLQSLGELSPISSTSLTTSSGQEMHSWSRRLGQKSTVNLSRSFLLC